MTALLGRQAGALPGRLKSNYGVLLGFVLGAVALLVVAPAVLSDFRLSLLGRFVCYGIVAVGIGLAWGRGGMLTLGQGVFFGLGGYVMAMHLKLSDAGPSGVPDFMRLYGSGAGAAALGRRGGGKMGSRPSGTPIVL